MIYSNLRLVRQFFDNPNRSTPMKHFHLRPIALRLNSNLAKLCTYCAKPWGGVLRSAHLPQKTPNMALSHCQHSAFPLPHSPFPFRLGKLCRLGSPGNSQKLYAIRRSQRCLHAKPLVLL